MSDDDPATDDGLGAARAALERVRLTGRAATRRPPRRRAVEAEPGADRDPVPLGALVDRLAQARAWTPELEVGAIVGRWPELVGPDVAEHCRPETFEEGVLTLRADSTAWAYQLRLLIPQLHSRLAREVGEGVIASISILGPTAPSWKHGPRSVSGGRGPRDTYG